MAPNINDRISCEPTAEDEKKVLLETISNLKSADDSANSDINQNLEKSTDNWAFLRKDIKWLNVVLITVFHAVAAYGFLTNPYISHWKTFLWG